MRTSDARSGPDRRLAAGDAQAAQPERRELATTSVISSYVRISAFGSQSRPSSGMQYTQRKLQRSVTEIRRYSIDRPN